MEHDARSSGVASSAPASEVGRARERRLSGFAENSYGNGHKDIAECETCGYLEWRCTHTTRPNGYTVYPMMGGGCYRCSEAFSRAPEVVSWVAAVLGRLKETGQI